MDLVRTSLIGGAFLACLVAAAVFAPKVNAQQAAVSCTTTQNSLNLVAVDQQLICDASLVKDVSVNGGSFLSADVSVDAAQASVGDSITWRITVANNSSLPSFPTGIVTVLDLLPAGFSLDSYNASIGTFASNAWTFELASNNDGYSTNLPAVLTLNTTATASGLYENIANLDMLDYCYDGCDIDYADGVVGNNSNSAWVQVSGAPVVLGESSTAQVQGLADTGDSTVQSLVAGALIVVTLAVALTGRLRTKTVKTDR